MTLSVSRQGIGNLKASFRNFELQSIHESFLRTVPSYSDQANVWMGLLKHYEWKSVVLLTSNDQDSRMIATRFTGLAAVKLKVSLFGEIKIHF